MSRSRGARTWLPVAVAVVAVDQLTKWWAMSELGDGRVIDLPGPAALRLSFNTGVAFGQGRGRGLGPVIAALGLAVIVVLVTSISRRAPGHTRVFIGLIVGGAVGNLIDRLVRSPGWFRGPVVDFIQAVDWFPIFNVADAAITVGGIALVISMSRSDNPRDDDAGDDDARDDDPGTKNSGNDDHGVSGTRSADDTEEPGTASGAETAEPQTSQSDS